MRTFLKIMVAIIVATAVAMVMMANGMNGKAVVCAYFGVGVMMCTLLGVFSEERKVKHDSIRHKYGYRRAA